MADRTSAALFAEIFKLLAADAPPTDPKALARRFWGMRRGLDFSPYQMYCDEALIKLGLARLGVDPEYPEEGETMLYGPTEDTDER